MMKKGFGRGVCFGRWRSGTGKEKGNGRNKKSEFSLLYYRVLCIIQLEKKKKSEFMFSLSPYGGKSFEHNLLIY